ncbi:hypothetical protein [Natronococcus sp.]|uniref:hypothetical protein n=1 Tax=Natronococcus sp. TaxID=35747 RepID=UPI003A4E523C
MSLVHRSRRILREDGVPSLLWRSIRFVWTTTVWRRELVQRLPARAVTLAFAVRSRLLPHVSDANPARPIRVDPDGIEYYHGSDDPWRLGHVIDGDWDEAEGRFEETTVYRSLEARFLEGADWEETELYAEYRDRLEAGDPYWRCTTEAELEAYFERIDALYETVAEEGYRSQRELLASDDADPREENTDAVHPVVQEIGVNVYRDGELVKKGTGFHRLAIAKLLDLEEIPVTVRVRHADWQAVRDEIRAASSPAELSERAASHLEHPDLLDVVPEDWRESKTEPTDRPDREASRTDDSEDDDVPVPRR